MKEFPYQSSANKPAHYAANIASLKAVVKVLEGLKEGGADSDIFDEVTKIQESAIELALLIDERRVSMNKVEKPYLEGMRGPISNRDCKILLAAMLAMTQDIHVVQDNLSEEEWKRSEDLCNELREYCDAVREQEIDR